MAIVSKGKYGVYKNRFEKVLASENGKRAFNFAYSWGAAIVVAGVLFKLLHLRGADIMLAIGMGIEVIMFFISAFDFPSKDYHWEEVFPALKTEEKGAAPQTHPCNTTTRHTPHITATEAKKVVGLPQIDLNNNDAESLTQSIKRLSIVTEQLGKMADLGASTHAYLMQLEQLSDGMRSFSESTMALTQVCGVLDHTGGYVRQMETLNKNLSGLNTIYEIQLKSISSQISTIDQINAGLNRIKEMYDNTSTDYCEESEKMTQLMSALNAVYYRMLDAMNMGMHPGITKPHEGK